MLSESLWNSIGVIRWLPRILKFDPREINPRTLISKGSHRILIPQLWAFDIILTIIMYFKFHLNSLSLKTTNQIKVIHKTFFTEFFKFEFIIIRVWNENYFSFIFDIVSKLWSKAENREVDRADSTLSKKSGSSLQK